MGAASIYPGGGAWASCWSTNDRSAEAVAASAGKNDSIESSETVTSVAVPNVVTVLMNLPSWIGSSESPHGRARPRRGRSPVGKRQPGCRGSEDALR